MAFAFLFMKFFDIFQRAPHDITSLFNKEDMMFVNIFKRAEKDNIVHLKAEETLLHIIGVPSDKITIQNGMIYINNIPIPQNNILTDNSIIEFIENSYVLQNNEYLGFDFKKQTLSIIPTHKITGVATNIHMFYIASLISIILYVIINFFFYRNRKIKNFINYILITALLLTFLITQYNLSQYLQNIYSFALDYYKSS